MESITIHIKSKEQANLFKQMAKALNLTFDDHETEDKVIYSAMEEGKKLGRATKSEQDDFIASLKSTK